MPCARLYSDSFFSCVLRCSKLSVSALQKILVYTKSISRISSSSFEDFDINLNMFLAIGSWSGLTFCMASPVGMRTVLRLSPGSGFRSINPAFSRRAMRIVTAPVLSPLSFESSEGLAGPILAICSRHLMSGTKRESMWTVA